MNTLAFSFKSSVYFLFFPLQGTEVYNAEQGKFVDLGVLDVMQIFGRAGRPQYDSKGEGIIITDHDKLNFYLKLLTRQHQIESQFEGRIPDNLNAEVSILLQLCYSKKFRLL